MKYNFEINNNSIIYEGCLIGDNFTIGHFALVRQNNVIGNNVRIGSYTEVAFCCVIHDDVSIHSKCFISEYSEIGNGAWIGPCVVFTNDKYPTTKNKNKCSPSIGKYAIIGAASVIMPGCKVGEYSLIGAHSTVNCDIPDGEVWAGSPAKFIKKRSDIDAYTIV